jgi:hypothetical protein
MQVRYTRTETYSGGDDLTRRTGQYRLGSHNTHLMSDVRADKIVLEREVHALRSEVSVKTQEISQLKSEMTRLSENISEGVRNVERYESKLRGAYCRLLDYIIFDGQRVVRPGQTLGVDREALIFAAKGHAHLHSPILSLVDMTDENLLTHVRNNATKWWPLDEVIVHSPPLSDV